jgi:hypothetical protein
MTTPEQPADPHTADSDADRLDTDRWATSEPHTTPTVEPGAGQRDEPAIATSGTAPGTSPAQGRADQNSGEAREGGDHNDMDRLGTEASRPTSRAAGEREPLFPTQRAHEYAARWDALTGGFVDEPRKAVAQADQLVSELLEELKLLLSAQRHSLEHGLDAEDTSTEDLRLALGRYRTFFDRLLSV